MAKRFGVGILAAGMLLAGVSTAADDGPQSVTVVNFPPVQQVAGKVHVGNPLRMESDFVKRKLTVLPARPQQVRDLTDGGELRTEGFARARLSLAGVATSRVAAPGVVGVILVPNDPDILETWQETGVAQLAVRVDAQVAVSERGLFAAEPVDFLPAFPSYRMYFYDTLTASVELRCHVYLTAF